MRFKTFLATLVAIFSFAVVTPQTASAFGFDKYRHDMPKGWGQERTVRHWVYQPRYHHVFLTHAKTDPYAYRYEPRGYYPYYNSGYWKHRSHVARERAHFVHPKYHAGWGANRKHWNHYGWHKKHHGRHDHSHW